MCCLLLLLHSIELSTRVSVMASRSALRVVSRVVSKQAGARRHISTAVAARGGGNDAAVAPPFYRLPDSKTPVRLLCAWACCHPLCCFLMTLFRVHAAALWLGCVVVVWAWCGHYSCTRSTSLSGMTVLHQSLPWISMPHTCPHRRP